MRSGAWGQAAWCINRQHHRGIWGPVILLRLHTPFYGPRPRRLDSLNTANPPWAMQLVMIQR
jgi:hypothetical protein